MLAAGAAPGRGHWAQGRGAELSLTLPRVLRRAGEGHLYLKLCTNCISLKGTLPMVDFGGESHVDACGLKKKNNAVLRICKANWAPPSAPF